MKFLLIFVDCPPDHNYRDEIPVLCFDTESEAEALATELNTKLKEKGLHWSQDNSCTSSSAHRFFGGPDPDKVAEKFSKEVMPIIGRISFYGNSGNSFIVRPIREKFDQVLESL